jgi:hypothetical protein
MGMNSRSSGRIASHRWLSVALVLMLGMLGAGCAKGRGGGLGTNYDVSAQNFRYHGMPSTIKSGSFTVSFSNHETFPITHEMILAQLPSGKSATDVISSAKVKGCVGGGDCESQYLHFGEIDDVSTGATISQVFNLPPGNYFFACWQQGTVSNPDSTTGPPHASKGMVFTFTVS